MKIKDPYQKAEGILQELPEMIDNSSIPDNQKTHLHRESNLIRLCFYSGEYGTVWGRTWKVMLDLKQWQYAIIYYWFYLLRRCLALLDKETKNNKHPQADTTIPSGEGDLNRVADMPRTISATTSGR